MTKTPRRLVQTSTEVKKQYKKNGVVVPPQKLKQLERGLELDLRATRCRESEERRKAAKKKRVERDAKEERARQQIGIGLATQMVGYSHTQAQLKNGMEAFLGVKKRQDEEKRLKEIEITEKLEAIALIVEKEPWEEEEDDGVNDDDSAEDIALDVTAVTGSCGQHFLDDDLDDDCLLQAHDLVMSDPVEETRMIAPTPPKPALPPSKPTEPFHAPTNKDLNFVRNHGPTNKIVEAVLDKLPDELVELLSQDISMKYPEWDPLPGLLHKLNPIGLPPHRLRIKTGCTVILLRDLNNSSALSRSQHLQVLRVDKHCLECLVLDGQLKGTKTILTRVPFLAKYRNQDQYPFQRAQFPVRVAIDYTPAAIPQDMAQSGFKLPGVAGRPIVPNVPPTRLASRDMEAKEKPTRNSGFRVPGVAASKLSSSALRAHTPMVKPVASPPSQFLDGWDDFLESGTQIARELSVDAPKTVAKASVVSMGPPPLNTDLMPPMSTQDLNFCMDDLDDECTPVGPAPRPSTVSQHSKSKEQTKELFELPDKIPADSKQSEISNTKLASKQSLPLASLKRSATTDTAKHGSKLKAQKIGPPAIDLSNLRPSQKPPSVSDRPGLKRKGFVPPAPPSKRRCASALHPVLPAKPAAAIVKPRVMNNDFLMSTQEVASFFDDDDDDEEDDH